MIKTITLTPGEVNCIDFDQQYPYYYIKKFSASDIYASVKKFIFVADEEEVTRIPAGSTGIVYSTLASEHVNLLCAEEAKIEVIGAFEKDINFTSGGGGVEMADTYSKAEINEKLSEKANSSELKTVALTGSYKDLSDTTDVATKNYVSNLLNNKVDKVYGKDLSTNDYTDEEVEKIQNNIYQIDTIKSTMGITCKNLANIDTSGDAEDFIYTVNPDKTVTCNGRATSSYALHIMSKPIRLSKNKKYILSGAVAGYVNLLIYYQKGTYEYEGEIYPRIYPQYNNESVQIKDTGEGCIFIPREDHDCFIMLNNVGKVDMTDIVVSPMLRTYDYLDDTEFEPHTDLLSMINDLTARVEALEN